MFDTKKTKMAMVGLELAEKLQDQLWKDLCGDLLGNGLYHVDSGFRRSSLAEGKEGVLRVGPEIFKPLYDKFLAIKSALGIDFDVNFYVTNDVNITAQSGIWHFNEDNYDILLSSGLIETFSDDEICYVIGHELGHFIHRYHKMYFLARHLYDKEDEQPKTLRYRLRLLSQLDELFCDRCGYIAAGSLEPCISSMFWFEHGMHIGRFGEDISGYIEKSEAIVRDMQKNAISYNKYSHPDGALRTVSLKLFAEQTDEEALNKTTLSLIEPLCHKVTEIYAMDQEIEYIVAFARMIEKKANLVPGAYREAVTAYLKRYMIITDDCYDSVKPEELDKIFENLLRTYVEFQVFSKYQLVEAACEMAFLNRKPSVAEIEFIRSIAVDKFEMHEIEFGQYVNASMYHHFNPKY